VLVISLSSVGTILVLLMALGIYGSATRGDSEIFDADSGFKPGTQITPQSLEETDPEAIFKTMLHNQLTKPVHQTNKEYFRDEQSFTEGQTLGVYQHRIDYPGRKVTSGSDSFEDPERGGGVDIQNRCVGDKEYTSYSGKGDWKASELSNSCMPTIVKSAAGEGIVPGGLTDGQADDYIRYLTTKFGNPFSVAKPELFDHDGKQYIKLPVTITPVRTSSGSYSGMQLFYWALKEAGIMPTDYPYSGAGSGASGFKITYYVDPATTLPAYAFMRETPALDRSGKPENDGKGLSVQRVQYEFPPQWQPYSLDDPKGLEPFRITWDRSIQ
jgi:hypothetical protein